MSQQAIEIAATLYGCRRTAINLLGPEKFKAKVEEWRPLIEAAKKKDGVDTIAAAQKMVEFATENGLSAMTTLIIFAVAVEMVEPSL